MKKLILITIFMIASLTMLGCQKQENTIKVLTSSGYEPYEMIDKTGKLIGFDIELMEALAKEIGVVIEWQDVDFKGIIASLQAKTADAAIAGISPSLERAEMVDFSDIYYNSLSGLSNYMIFKDSFNYTKPEDLKGLTIGAQIGTVQAEYITNLKEKYDFKVDLRDTNAQIVEEIKTNRIDVLIVESPVAKTIIQANTGLKSSHFESETDQYQGLSIAFPKNSEWTEKFNIALRTLTENGTLNALMNKWLIKEEQNFKRLNT
ncbi:ABC transporter substrate-binding protein [Mycoplasmatota bacterium]|nr:ABC transporter substrate-binding protein [Mycoplasmatota bacterium]